MQNRKLQLIRVKSSVDPPFTRSDVATTVVSSQVVTETHTVLSGLVILMVRMPVQFLRTKDKMSRCTMNKIKQLILERVMCAQAPKSLRTHQG